MNRSARVFLAAGAMAIIAGGCTALRAQAPELVDQMQYIDAICTFFGKAQSSFFQLPKQSNGGTITGNYSSNAEYLNALTIEVMKAIPAPAANDIPATANVLPGAPGGSRTGGAASAANYGLIDQYLFPAMQEAGVQPAPPTTDWEFIRRVALDLTGRIPTPARVLQFVADSTPNKRANLVNELIASPTWVDKWTMYFGDLYKNNSSNTQIDRYQPGVLAFYNYIKTSLQSNKPYNVMATELITAQGDNSYTTGQIGFTVGGVVTGGPQQDIWDQQVANIADTFLGMYHVNCLLCHNGAGHLTGLSLWGQQQTRIAAWGMSAFLAHTDTYSTAVSSAATTPRYWTVTDTNPKFQYDYALNTTTGNRPARQPIGTVKTIGPSYMFTGETPKPGESYRAALARMITADPQFARATVNYMWAYFFGVGLVDPPDQFDPARLDPDNPPAASTGYTLQPSNPRLLQALTNAFIANNYDLQWLQRTIVNSQAYQLSARYDGQWNPTWSTLYARKNVRRLWSEEMHDAVTISSNQLPNYNTGQYYGNITYAMQFPEPLGLPDGTNGNISMMLDAFLRGNRDDQARASDGSILQTLDMMNDSFVMNRISATTPASGLLPSNLNSSNTNLVNSLFLAVLSRYPNATEMQTALANLSNPSTRTQQAQYLLWSLYNKVDFLFNY